MDKNRCVVTTIAAISTAVSYLLPFAYAGALGYVLCHKTKESPKVEKSPLLCPCKPCHCPWCDPSLFTNQVESLPNSIPVNWVTNQVTSPLSNIDNISYNESYQVIDDRLCSVPRDYQDSSVYTNNLSNTNGWVLIFCQEDKDESFRRVE